MLQFTDYKRCACAQGAGLNALSAGVQRWGLRPHGGHVHVAFAAHHRRHTERPPCALCSQCPISRSTLPLPTPQTIRLPSLLKAPPPRLAPTPPSFPPHPHQRHEYLSPAQLILLSLNEPVVRRVTSENDHERPPRCSWPNLSPSVAELTARCAYELRTRDKPSSSSWVAATILPSLNHERAASICRCAASPVKSAAGCRFGRRRRRGRVFLRHPKHRHNARCKLAQH